MTKTMFLKRLETALSKLSDDDIYGSIDYYTELIDERIESGMSEEAAVADLGDPEKIAKEIMLGMSFRQIIKSKCKKIHKLPVWEIVLMILGLPILLILAVSALVIVISIYASLWAIWASVWVTDIALAITGIASFIPFVTSLVSAPAAALLALGIGLTSLGISVPLFAGCVKLTSIFVKLHLQITRFFKRIMIGNKKASQNQ